MKTYWQQNQEYSQNDQINKKSQNWNLELKFIDVNGWTNQGQFEKNQVSTRKDSGDSYLSKNNYKTEVCKFWILNGQCPYADTCIFAHGVHQIRQRQSPSSKYKTKHCVNFKEKGYCFYGPRCQFIHQNQNPNFYKHCVLQLKNYADLFFLRQKRLKVFRSICNTNRSNEEQIQQFQLEVYSFQKSRLYSL